MLTDDKPIGGAKLLREEKFKESQTATFKEYIEGLGPKSALNKTAVKKIFLNEGRYANSAVK